MQFKIAPWKILKHPSSRRNRFRSILLENLETRVLMAGDVAQSLLASVELAQSDTGIAQQPQARDRFATTLRESQLVDTSELSVRASQAAMESLNFAQQTFAPENQIADFERGVPKLSTLQGALIGSGLGAELDWSQLETGESLSTSMGTTTIDSAQLQGLASGAFVQQLPPSLRGASDIGGVCLADGRLVSRIPSGNSGLGRGEGEEGSGAVGVPALEFPTLELAGMAGSPDNFAPATQSSDNTAALYGSFDMDSLSNPDYDASGTNWVHTVDRTWNSDQQWSFTERLVMAFNLGDSQNDGGNMSDLSVDPGDGSGGGASNPELDENGSWASTTSISRSGFFRLTFTASLGMTTPAAVGVVWSISVDYRDTISISAGASGSSVATPPTATTAGEGEDDYGYGDYGYGDGYDGGGAGSDDSTLPDDFVSHAAWNASAMLVIYSGGGFSVSSTPAIAGDGVVERAIVANGYSDTGGNVLLGSNWSASSSSGNLTPLGVGGCISCRSGAPTLPLPNDGDLGIPYESADDAIGTSDPESDMPFDPLGDFEGYGHGSASSGGNAAKAGAGVNGSWNLQATMRQGMFKDVVGGAFAAMAADTGGEGKSKHLFVYKPEPTIAPLNHGYLTTTVMLTSGWDYSGDEDENLSAEVNSQFTASPSGELVIDDSGDNAEIIGNADSQGFDFLNLDATIVGTQAWNKENQATSNGMIVYANGHDNGVTTLKYNSTNYGDGVGEYQSVATGLSAQNATATSELNGHGKELLLITTSGDTHAAKEEHWADEHWVGEQGGSSSSLEKFVNKYEVSGSLTATLQADDSVTWSGSAGETVVSKVKYKSDLEWAGFENELNESGLDWAYDEIRDADFERTATLTSTFNAASGAFDNAFSLGGDSYVTVAGHDIYGDAWEKTDLELALEDIFTDGSNGYPVPAEPDPNGGLPPDYQYPSNPGGSGWLAWFGGSAGDSFDQGVNFLSGVGDNMTFGASKYMRQNIVGFDGVDYETGWYSGGEWVGFGAGLIGGGGVLKGAANAVDDVGRCANWLSKLWRGGCFVAGTRVTLSEMPRGSELENCLWEEDFSAADRSASHLARLRERSRVPRAGEGIHVDNAPSAATAMHFVPAVSSPASSLLIPIEEVPLGARVPTKNPKPWEFDDSLPEPDEATWQKLSLTIERKDGGIVDVELLRPQSWIEGNHIRAGQRLPLNIPELEVEGFAYVSSIEECPAISSGEGSAVTGRFITRRVDETARIEVLGADGTSDILEGTTIHPIWSLDRNDWVPLGELHEGEQLQGAAGPVTILTHQIFSRTTPVYNIEVHGEHVYGVGALSLVVHNSCYVYTANQNGKVIYVGITNNLARRTAEHAHRFAIQPLQKFASRFDARAVEQSLIMKHGLGRNGGSLFNKINSISTSNPAFMAALQRAAKLGY